MTGRSINPTLRGSDEPFPLPAARTKIDEFQPPDGGTLVTVYQAVQSGAPKGYHLSQSRRAVEDLIAAAMAGAPDPRDHPCQLPAAREFEPGQVWVCDECGALRRRSEEDDPHGPYWGVREAP